MRRYGLLPSALVLAVVVTACNGGGGTGGTTTAPPTTSEPATTTAPPTTTEPPETTEPPAAELALTSPAFSEGEDVPVEFSCDGANANPPLEWTGVPEGTEQLALLLEDPDAPGATFVHWVVHGIDPAAEGVGSGEVPEGATEGPNHAGAPGYFGPCPPPGPAHRYIFTLFALGSAPDVDAGTAPQEYRAAFEAVALAEVSLLGMYGVGG